MRMHRICKTQSLEPSPGHLLTLDDSREAKTATAVGRLSAVRENAIVVHPRSAIAVAPPYHLS